MRTAPLIAAALAMVPAGFLAPRATAQTPAQMFTWENTGQAGLTDTLMLNAHRSPEKVVAMAREAWAGVPDDDRVLILAPWEMYAAQPFDAPLAEIVKHGPDFSAMQSWWTGTLSALDDAGLAPAQVAIDYEEGIGYWNLDVNSFDKGRRDHFVPLWQDADALAALPQELQQYTANQIHWRDKETVQAWNRFAGEVTRDALQQAFIDPLQDVFPKTQAGNYGDARFAWSMKDKNGWTLTDDMIGDTSHPVLYDQDADTNLDILANIAAAFDDPADVIPWIKAPRLMGRQAFEQTITGAYELGVRDFLLFNPASDDTAAVAADNAFAAQIIAQLGQSYNAAPLPASNLPEPAAAGLALAGLTLLRRAHR